MPMPHVISCVEVVEFLKRRDLKLVAKREQIIGLTYASLIASAATGFMENECRQALIKGRKITETVENKHMVIVVSWVRQ